ELGLLALTGRYSLSDTWAVQSTAYGRRFKQTHIDGNDGEFVQCDESSAAPGALCLDSEEFLSPSEPPPASWRNQFIIYDPDGHPIPFTEGGVPYGTVDRSWTDTWTVGGSLQATNTLPLLGHDNYFVAGASIDHGSTTFHSNSPLGYIFPDLFVGPNADVAGTGTVIHKLPDITVDPQFSVLFGPVKLKAHNSYYGVYGADTFDITARLSLTVSARLNIADIEMDDRGGQNPALNSYHSFSRVNPQAGLTYKVLPGITAYL